MTDSRELFWELLEREYVAGLLFCRKMAGDRDNGDDLYQDALITAFSRFDDLRDHDSFRPWLYRIIISTFKRTVRRPWWQRRRPMTEQVEQSLGGVDPTDAHTARRWLERAFGSISVDEQVLVALYELEGWSVAELAELSGKKPGAVKVRLHRARARMRQAIERYIEPQTAGESRPREDEPCNAAKPDID